MKICILGNSHAAALRFAISNKTPPAGHTVDFFASRGRWAPKIKIIDGKVFFAQPREQDKTTVENAMRDGLVISAFDAFVISACGWPGLRNEYLEQDPREHPLGHLHAAPWKAASDDSALISKAVFSEIVYHTISSHPTIAAAHRLRENFSGQIIIQPWPAPSRQLKVDTDWYLNKRFTDCAPDAWRAFFAAQYAALVRIATEMKTPAQVLPYPLNNILEDGFMDPSLCAAEDQWHGNGRYGAMILDQIYGLI